MRALLPARSPLSRTRRPGQPSLQPAAVRRLTSRVRGPRRAPAAGREQRLKSASMAPSPQSVIEIALAEARATRCTTRGRASSRWAAAGRLARPALTAALTHWRDDWQEEQRAALEEGQRLLRAEAEGGGAGLAEPPVVIVPRGVPPSAPSVAALRRMLAALATARTVASLEECSREGVPCAAAGGSGALGNRLRRN